LILFKWYETPAFIVHPIFILTIKEALLLTVLCFTKKCKINESWLDEFQVITKHMQLIRTIGLPNQKVLQSLFWFKHKHSLTVFVSLVKIFLFFFGNGSFLTISDGSILGDMAALSLHVVFPFLHL
jgi:hypothetical protein